MTDPTPRYFIGFREEKTIDLLSFLLSIKSQALIEDMPPSRFRTWPVKLSGALVNSHSIEEAICSGWLIFREGIISVAIFLMV